VNVKLHVLIVHKIEHFIVIKSCHYQWNSCEVDSKSFDIRVIDTLRHGGYLIMIGDKNTRGRMFAFSYLRVNEDIVYENEIKNQLNKGHVFLVQMLNINLQNECRKNKFDISFN
jgi:hypothetical protein